MKIITMEIKTPKAPKIRLRREIVTFRKRMNKLLRIPKDVRPTELSDLTVTSVYTEEVSKDNFKDVILSEKTLKGGATVIIECYANKQIIKAYADINSRYLQRI